MMLFMSFSPFFRVSRAISETCLLTKRVTQRTRVVCKIPATHVGILRQSDGEGRFCPLYLQRRDRTLQRGIPPTTRLPIKAATVMLIFIILVHRMEAAMGDKSLKSKQRDQKQKDAAKAGSTTAAKSKQDGYTRLQQTATKGKK